MIRRLLPLAAAAALACAGARSPPPSGTGDEAARLVLDRFARALESGRFEEAHALLSARWRAAYTPGRLALDFRGGGAGAREAAVRAAHAARVAAAGVLVRGDGEARLAVGDRRAAVLVVEAGGWRVDALE